jgi:uncharacterized protein (DUF58 family)
LPTKFGASFLFGAIFMLLIGSAYENNLVNLLGFFMMAILFTAMIATHNNIKGIEIARVEAVHGFAGDTFPVSLVVRNTSRSIKTNCDFTIRGFKKVAQYDARSSISPGSDARLLASFVSPRRGLHSLKRFSLSTTAPFGLFHAWQIRPSEQVAIIYPRRSGNLNWSLSNGSTVGDLNRASGSEDYKQHRNYQSGDNLRRVDWQAYARGRTLMTKEFDEPTGEGLHFDFAKLSMLDQERRLEQLSKWVEQAIQRGQTFSMTLPGKKLGPDQGLAFAHRAWNELAKFDEATGVGKESA